MRRCQMTKGPTGPGFGEETWSSEHNYGVLSANMRRIIMSLIPFSDDWTKLLIQPQTERMFHTSLYDVRLYVNYVPLKEYMKYL